MSVCVTPMFSFSAPFPLTTTTPHSRTFHVKDQQLSQNTQLAATSSAQNLSPSRNRPTMPSTPPRRIGKFQSGIYDKPIVLIGRSTDEHDELSRLALSVTSKIYKNGLDLDATEVASQKTTSQLEALVLDLKDVPPEQEEMASNKIKEYYQKDFLVIYVNVHNQVVGDLEQLLIDHSDYELCIKKQDTEGNNNDEDNANNEKWDNIEWQFQRLLARAFLPLAVPGSDSPSINTAHLTMGQNTFFLSLSFPKIMDAEPYIEAMCQDVDAMEFRADLLECRNDRFELLYSLQQLRQMCRSHATRAPMLPFLGEVMDDCMPVVYTVRTAHQAGTYPDDQEGITKMFELLQLGLRSGVEVLDVESAWDEKKTDDLLRQVEDRYASQILGSHHVVGKTVTDEEAIEFNRKCCLGGRAHGAKVVLSIDDEKDDHQALHAAEASKEMAAKAGEPVIPHIGLILGNVGKYSRVVNIPFTPVTHESLPFVAAPGQMTASELMATRFIMGLVKPMKYAILGYQISYSVSPAMHGAAFAATQLPYSFDLIDMDNVEEFVTSDFWNDPLFGGCSVTIPHKQNIIPYLDELTDAAKAIGAVNTVIVMQPSTPESSKRILVGDNTDWKGIFNPIQRKIGTSSQSDTRSNGIALILGGGGTARAAAYAASQLGLDRIYYNRTPSKAHELAEMFGGSVASNLEQDGPESLGSILRTLKGEVRAVISTLPAAAEFELPSWFVKESSKMSADETKPIVFDVNYKPYWTKLLEQGNEVGFPIIRGSEMLWEQGVGQFQLWTGRPAPYKVMKSVVLHNCLPENEQ
jgi:Shikimate 5-dehydrogenase